MSHIKVKNIKQLFDSLAEAGMPTKEIDEMTIYIGDDEELNGIHTAYYAELISDNEDFGDTYAELINENGENIPFEGRAILIS